MSKIKFLKNKTTQQVYEIRIQTVIDSYFFFDVFNIGKNRWKMIRIVDWDAQF